MFGLPRFLTARDAAAATFDRNFLPQAREVTLANLSARVPAASGAVAEVTRDHSQHQRSLVALAEVIGSPAASTGGVDTHARDFLDRSQGP